MDTQPILFLPRVTLYLELLCILIMCLQTLATYVYTICPGGVGP